MPHQCCQFDTTHAIETGGGIWTRPVFGPFVTIKVWMLRKSHRAKLLRYTWNLNWGPNTGLPKVGYRLLFRKPLRFAFCLAGWKSKLEPFPNKRTYLLDQFVLVLKLWPIEILGSKHRPPPRAMGRIEVQKAIWLNAVYSFGVGVQSLARQPCSVPFNQASTSRTGRTWSLSNEGC